MLVSELKSSLYFSSLMTGSCILFTWGLCLQLVQPSLSEGQCVSQSWNIKVILYVFINTDDQTEVFLCGESSGKLRWKFFHMIINTSMYQFRCFSPVFSVLSSSRCVSASTSRLSTDLSWLVWSKNIKKHFVKGAEKSLKTDFTDVSCDWRVMWLTCSESLQLVQVKLAGVQSVSDLWNLNWKQENKHKISQLLKMK